jgi:hypothetical protein
MVEVFRLTVRSSGAAAPDLAASRSLASALNRGGIAVEMHAPPPDPRSKGEPATGALLFKVAEATLGKVIGLTVELFRRPGAPPAEIELEAGNGKARIKFDPRTLDPAQIPSLVEALARGLSRT